ncbi:hypothetical protein VTI74DRAFT_10417 [Chaetomium olivicolor]
MKLKEVYMRFEPKRYHDALKPEVAFPGCGSRALKLSSPGRHRFPRGSWLRGAETCKQPPRHGSAEPGMLLMEEHVRPKKFVIVL